MGNYLKCDSCGSWFETRTGACKCQVKPAPTGAQATTAIPKKAAVSQPQRVAVPRPVQPVKPLPEIKPVVEADPSTSGLTGARLEVAELAKLQAARRGGPKSFAGKWAYRGVNSGPDVYTKRGGFFPHQITSLQLARTSLQSLVNKQDGLSQYAFRWQDKKNKEDGYFLSTGLSAEESYDTYPFLYRIDIGSLHRREWSEVFNEGEYMAESVKNCLLYTDRPDINASTMIAVICMEGGPGRSYELLIMSPVPPALCQVAHPQGSKQFITFPQWMALPKDKDKDKSKS